MTVTTIILLSLAGISILAILFAWLRSRNNSLLSHRYSEALQAENNGDLELAIQLYQEALQKGQENKIGDKRLFNDMESRLKTLRISTDFEQSFRKKTMAV